MAKPTYAECPRCGARVKKDNLRRHLNSVHGTRGPGERKREPKAGPRGAVPFPWRLFGALPVAAVLIVAGYWILTRPSEGPGSGENPIAVLDTSLGTIRFELDARSAPGTAERFKYLAVAGKYDGTTFYRVAPGFVIQGGEVSGTGTIPWEDTGIENVRYSVAMARERSPNDPANKDSAKGDFFISLADNPHLDNYTYAYVVFARVVAGFAVVDAIASLVPPDQPNYDGAPTQTVTIRSVTILG